MAKINYKTEMLRLAAKHSFGFLHNPGGGEFTSPYGNCQISTYDDKADYGKFLKALKKWGLE